MRRAQAALEFLTTYGWAFVVMMTMVAAISYFGITNPVSFVPDQCRFSTDVNCEDFYITTIDVPGLLGPGTESVGLVLIDVKQTSGRTAYLTDFSCVDVLQGGQVLGFVQQGDEYSSLEGSLGPGGDTDIKQWNPGQRKTLKCLFSKNPFAGLEGELVRVPLEITMQRREGGFNHVIEGELIGKVH